MVDSGDVILVLDYIVAFKYNPLRIPDPTFLDVATATDINHDIIDFETGRGYGIVRAWSVGVCVGMGDEC